MCTVALGRMGDIKFENKNWTLESSLYDILMIHRRYVCMHICMYACMYVLYMYISMCVCMYVCMCVCMYVCMNVCMYVCVRMYECMNV